MQKTEIGIREIDNGWLLTIECDDLTIAVKERYFENLQIVLTYLEKRNLEGLKKD